MVRELLRAVSGIRRRAKALPVRPEDVPGVAVHQRAERLRQPAARSRAARAGYPVVTGLTAPARRTDQAGRFRLPAAALFGLRLRPCARVSAEGADGRWFVGLFVGLFIGLFFYARRVVSL